jgi:flagellar protein FliL
MSEAASNEEAPKKKSKKKLIIILVLILVLVGGGVGYFLFAGSKDPEAEEEHHEEPHHFSFTKLQPDFIVNLAQSGSFLKAQIDLKIDETILENELHALEEEGHGEGHAGSGGGEGPALNPYITERMPKIRDVIIMTLSSKTADEVLSGEGKIALKEELIEVINEALEFEEGPIVDLYFSEFIVQ